MPKLIAYAIIAVCAAILLLALNTARQATGWTVAAEAPDRRAARLAEHWRVIEPPGTGRAPRGAAMLLSGCDGVHDNMGYWAERFADAGRTSMILDSHAPRGLNRLESWRLVCAGQALSGAERAGDVAVALAGIGAVGAPAGDVVLFGASHGGWSVMEFVTFATSGEVPPGLTGWPAPPKALLARVSAIVLLYPYCGLLNGADAARWAGAPPTLMVLAGSDTIVSTPDCLERAELLSHGGAIVQPVVIAGADHGFDQREKSLLSTLTFDAGQRDAARDAISAFLAEHAGGSL